MTQFAELKKEMDSMLPSAEINRRLHLFNLSQPRDWSLFRDIPPIQQVSVMYPEAIIPFGYTEEQRRQHLIDMFGPL